MRVSGTGELKTKMLVHLACTSSDVRARSPDKCSNAATRAHNDEVMMKKSSRIFARTAPPGSAQRAQNSAPDELRRAGSGLLTPPHSREGEGGSAALRPPRHSLQTEIVQAGPWFVKVILSA